MYTYLFTATPSDLESMSTEIDVLTFIENSKPQVGGGFSRERLDYLADVFLVQGHESFAAGSTLANGAPFYQFDADLVQELAKADHDALLDASVSWDEGAWQDTEVNRMDLAGFLLDLGGLSRDAVKRDRNLYFVTVED